MRLLYSNPQGDLCLTDDLNEDSYTIPRYAVLSHTWGADCDEVKFDDIQNGTARHKDGYVKLEFCAEQAWKDGIDHFWIDTCCIKKSSDSELSEAVRSMFRWYKNATKCYVFLSDVSSSKRDVNCETGSTWEKSFRNSRWFKRGWTLQELLAPGIVEFFSRERVLLGCRDQLVQPIYEITGIPVTALQGKSITDFSIEQRLTWAESRQTTKAEDKAYCLFGIFDVQLPVLYGEGQDKAVRRLKREIEVTLDQLDNVIKKKYDDGRLDVERLSGKSISLDHCFINLGIIDHVCDSDIRLASSKTEQNPTSRPSSKFSLAARLNVETPPQSHQVSLSTLFEPRDQGNLTRPRPNRILIWGRAGMGKTTLCKKIVFDVCRKGLWKDLYDRVIWIPLRKLRRTKSRSTIELLQNEFSFTGLGERISEDIKRLINNDRTLFLLDGLDEVSFALDEDSPAGGILHDLLSQPHVIITSRPHSTRVLDFKAVDLELETVGFYPQQIEEYLQQVVKATDMPDKTVVQIQSFIAEHFIVKSLARIPIQLDAICYTWNAKHSSFSITTMTNLYQRISRKLWKNSILRLDKTNDGGHVTKQQLDHYSWRQLEKLIPNEVIFLQELGFRGLCEDIIEFSVEDVERLSLRQVFRDKLVHLLFLRISDSSMEAEDQTFHFIHLTFQEFFAAQYFVSYWTRNEPIPPWESNMHGELSHGFTGSITPEDFVKSRKYVDRYDIFWRFVVGLLVAQPKVQHIHRFLDMVEHQPIDLVGLLHQRLVNRCLSELRAGTNDLQHRLRTFEDRYVKWTLHGFRLCKKWNLHASLYRLPQDVEFSDYILAQLLDEPETESVALSILRGRSGISPEMLDILIRKLRTKTGRRSRRDIIKIIGSQCDRDQSDQVFQLIHDMQTFGITLREIASAWGNYSRRNRTNRLREPAIKILAQLVQDPDKTVQYNAMLALARQAPLSVLAVKTMTQVLQTPDSSDKMILTAISAIRKQVTLPVSVVEPLVHLLKRSDSTPEMKSSVMLALCKNATFPVIATEALVEMLQSSDTNLNFCAIEVCKKLAAVPSPVVEALVHFLHRTASAEDMRFRGEAVYLLARQSNLPRSAVDGLSQLLQPLYSSLPLRWQIAMASHEHATLPDSKVEVLVQLLQDPELQSKLQEELQVKLQSKRYPPLRWKPLTTIPTSVVSAIAGLLQHPDLNVRGSAAMILSSQPDLSRPMVGTLVKLLQSSDVSYNVRQSTAIYLCTQATLSDTEVETLVQQLQGLDSYGLCNALVILSKKRTLLGPVVSVVVGLLQHPDEDVRWCATEALRRQRNISISAVDALVRLIQSPDEDLKVWNHALRAISKQVTLPDSAVSLLIQLIRALGSLPNVDLLYGQEYYDTYRTILSSPMVKRSSHIHPDYLYSIYKSTWQEIINRKEIRFVIQTFRAPVLRHFIKHWYLQGTAVYFTHKDCFCIQSSRGFEQVPIDLKYLEQFHTEWQKARDGLGLPQFEPVLSGVDER